MHIYAKGDDNKPKKNSRSEMDRY